MKRLFLATLLFAFATASNAIVLTFDDIPGVQQDKYGPIGTYAGYNFGSFGSIQPANELDWVDTVSPFFDSGAVSGDFTMVNNYGGTGVITAVGGGLFRFAGMSAETWDQDDPRPAILNGYYHGALAWSSVITLGSSFGQFAGVPINIDRLQFDPLDPSNFFVVDNLNLAAAVPEPASLPLLGLGLTGVMLLRRRARKSAAAD